MRTEAPRCFAPCLLTVIAADHEKVCSNTLGKPTDGLGDIAAFDGRDNAARRKTEIAFSELSGHEFFELRLKAGRIWRSNVDYSEFRGEIRRQLRGGKERYGTIGLQVTSLQIDSACYGGEFFFRVVRMFLHMDAGQHGQRQIIQHFCRHGANQKAADHSVAVSGHNHKLHIFRLGHFHNLHFRNTFVDEPANRQACQLRLSELFERLVLFSDQPLRHGDRCRRRSTQFGRNKYGVDDMQENQFGGIFFRQRSRVMGHA